MNSLSEVLMSVCWASEFLPEKDVSYHCKVCVFLETGIHFPLVFISCQVVCILPWRSAPVSCFLLFLKNSGWIEKLFIGDSFLITYHFSNKGMHSVLEHGRKLLLSAMTVLGSASGSQTRRKRDLLKEILVLEFQSISKQICIIYYLWKCAVICFL